MHLHQVLLFVISTRRLRRKVVHSFNRQQIYSVFEAKGVISRIGEVEFSLAFESLQHFNQLALRISYTFLFIFRLILTINIHIEQVSVPCSPAHFCILRNFPLKEHLLPILFVDLLPISSAVVCSCYHH